MSDEPINEEDWQIGDAIGSFEDAIREIGRRVSSGQEPPPSTGYFMPSRAQVEPIAVGDFVRWNGKYQGRVVSLNCESAVVHEKNNLALGHSVSWRMRLDALTRIDEC